MQISNNILNRLKERMATNMFGRTKTSQEQVFDSLALMYPGNAQVLARWISYNRMIEGLYQEQYFLLTDEQIISLYWKQRNENIQNFWKTPMQVVPLGPLIETQYLDYEAIRQRTSLG